MECCRPGDYATVRKIGQGSFGEVHVARHLQTGELVALKRIYVRSPDSGVPVNVVRELEALQAFDHCNIVALHGVFVKGSSIVLVQELCAADLGRVVRSCKPAIPEVIVKGILKQLLQGLHACELQGILHRDIKPSNVLITYDGMVKLADFGLARPCEASTRPKYTNEVATRWYRAPELLYGAKHYSSAVDMWAAGCVFAEMLGRAPMFAGLADLDQLAKMHAVLGSIDEVVWPGVSALPDWGKVQFPSASPVPLSQLLPGASSHAINLLTRMLRYSPDARPTPSEALLDEFFAAAPAAAQPSELAAFVQDQL